MAESLLAPMTSSTKGHNGGTGNPGYGVQQIHESFKRRKLQNHYPYW